MIKYLTFLLFVVTASVSFGQEIKAEFDKNHDFTKYKTFSFGHSEILTPKDQRQVSDATLDGWIKNAIVKELQLKGLKKVDSAADLVVTYAIGTLARSTTQSVGPAVITPGSDATNQKMYNYQQTSLIIDMNNRKDFLVWRINSTTNMSPADKSLVIDQVVEKGFRKYSMQPRKDKKRK